MAALGIYPQACKFLKLKHHIHSSNEKSLIERAIQYIKDRTECFDDYFPCRKEKCKYEFLLVCIYYLDERQNGNHVIIPIGCCRPGRILYRFFQSWKSPWSARAFVDSRLQAFLPLLFYYFDSWQGNSCNL